MHSRLVFLSSILLALVAATAAQARQQTEWTKLAERSVAPKVERDVIPIGKSVGTYTKLHLKAYGSDVYVLSMSVVYGNKSRDTFRINKLLREGARSRSIDLRGGRRAIRRVELIYRSRPSGNRRATVAVFGDQLLKDVQVIGTERVRPRNNRVVFTIGADRGRFTSMAIKALDRPLRVRWIMIVFGNGQEQRVNLDGRLDEDELSKAIDFKGEGRFVRRIVAVVRPPFRNPGRLRLFAKEAPRPAPIVEIPRGWVKFGSKTVGFKNDRDVMRIGADAGWFSKIALRARDNDIFVKKVTIVYGNGQQDSYTINRELRRNSRTPPLDLTGGDRRIDRIEFVYRSERNRRGRATMEVFGEHSDKWRKRKERHAGWTLLGAQRAGLIKKDSDVFQVGRDAGRFRSIRVSALDRDVRMYGMQIVYGNGDVENVPVYGTLHAGDSTDAYDLKGKKRFIRHIAFRYRTKLNFKGLGTVELWGKR